jgi:hypothetical protein
MEDQYEDKFDKDNGEILLDSAFIEVRGDAIFSAGYVTEKFRGMDLYAVSPVNMEDKEKAELGFIVLLPIETFVMKGFRFYSPDCLQKWEEDINSLLELKKKKEEDAKKALAEKTKTEVK